MFGLGFTEILLIAVIALLFIGPDKLPDTMRQIARGLGKAKRMFEDTKSSIENELRVDDLRAEALQYRTQIENAKKDLSSFKNIANDEITQIKQSATLENPLAKEKKQSPKEPENDDTFDELFDKAQKDFEELENVTPNIAKEESKESQEISTPKATGFKNLKSKES